MPNTSSVSKLPPSHRMVLWPIFTSNELIYTSQTGERMDIQATVIGNPGEGYTISSGYPIAAAYVDDATTLLGLIT